MIMKDTPRTDANDLGWQFNEQHGDFDSLSDNPMPWLDFAKMLERELTTVTEQRDVALQCHKWCYEDRKRIIEELAAVTEQRDRLAEALRWIVVVYATEAEYKQVAQKAIAAVKGGSDD
jgi:hypothetical protein